MTLRRSTLLRGTAAALASTLWFAARRARAADDTIRIGSVPIDPTAQVYYADELGYFKRAGLNVEITSFPNGGAAAAALAGGAIDVSIADSVSMASAHAHGVPISFIAPAAVYTAAAPTYAIIVPVRSPIETAKDFTGKIVAVNGLKNILQIPVEAWIDNNGGDAKSVKFFELPFNLMTAAMKDGRVDAASVSEPFITSAVATGEFRAISQSDHGLASEFAVSGWTVTNAWAARHTDQVKSLVEVLAATAKWANANHAQSAQILIKVSGMSPDLATKLLRVHYGDRLEARLYQPVFDAAAKYGVISASFPATDVFYAG